MKSILTSLILGSTLQLSYSAVIIDTSTRNGGFESNGFWEDVGFIYDPDTAYSGNYYGAFSPASQSSLLDIENGIAISFEFFARRSETAEVIGISFSNGSTPYSGILNYMERPIPTTEWQRYSGTFVFTDAWENQQVVDILLTSTSADGGFRTSDLDDVSILQIPEPEPIFLLLVIFSIIGVFRLTRRCSQPLAASL